MVFLVGVGLGAAFSAPVGPVALSLVGISSLRGTRDQLRALIGTCLGHALLASAALAVLGSGGTSGGAGGLLGLVVALAFCVLGLLLIVRAPQAIGLVDRVQRPFTALFVLSVANPMAALSWLGLLHAADLRRVGPGEGLDRIPQRLDSDRARPEPLRRAGSGRALSISRTAPPQSFLSDSKN